MRRNQAVIASPLVIPSKTPRMQVMIGLVIATTGLGKFEATRFPDERSDVVCGVLDEMRGDFKWQDNDDGEEVKKVVNGGGGEGARELAILGDVPEGDQSVGDGGANVGPHDDWHCRGDIESTARHDGHDHGSNCGGGLNETGRQNPD